MADAVEPAAEPLSEHGFAGQTSSSMGGPGVQNYITDCSTLGVVDCIGVVSGAVSGAVSGVSAVPSRAGHPENRAALRS